jgi:hypothetical protein
MEQIITQPNCNKTDDPLSLLFGTYQIHTDTQDDDYSHIEYDVTVW